MTVKNSDNKTEEISAQNKEEDNQSTSQDNNNPDKIEADNPLKKALEAERKARKELEKQLKETAYSTAKKEGDIAALEKSWQDKIAQKLAEKEQEIQAEKERANNLQTVIQKTIVEKTALDLAHTVASTPENAKLILPHILKDITGEIGEEGVQIRILQDGKPSALSLDEYKDNLTKNPLFAGVLKKTQASGAANVKQHLAANSNNLTNSGTANQEQAALANRVRARLSQKGL